LAALLNLHPFVDQAYPVAVGTYPFRLTGAVRIRT
jgi:hypothetical protein